MKLYVYELGSLSTNCYVLVDENTLDAVAIDIGGDEGFLLLEELKQGYKIKNVLLTHCHFDHAGGVYKFYERGAGVYNQLDRERFFVAVDLIHQINAAAGTGNGIGRFFGNQKTVVFIHQWLKQQNLLQMAAGGSDKRSFRLFHKHSPFL